MVRVSLALLSALFSHLNTSIDARKPVAASSVSADTAYQLGASALNLTAKLIATTDEQSASGLDHSDANYLRRLGAELSTPDQTQQGAKVALKLGVDALKLGAKLLEKTLPSESLYENGEQDRSSHSDSVTADHTKVPQKSTSHQAKHHKAKRHKFLLKEGADEAEEVFDSVAKGTYFEEPPTTPDATNDHKTTLARGQSKGGAQITGDIPIGPVSTSHSELVGHPQEQGSQHAQLDVVGNADTSKTLKFDHSWGGAGAQPAQPPPSVKLIMKHMSKTGGSLMIALLNNMTQHLAKHNEYHFVHYVDELSPLIRSHGEHQSFVISSVRNPCDWYVDLWAKTEEGDRQALNSKFGTSRDPEPFFDDNNLDAKKFSNWMLWALGKRSGVGGANIMSVRFWETLIAGKHVFGGYNGQRLDEYTQSYNNNPNIESALESFAPSSVVDCWVSDESYAKDLRKCLHNYERLAGAELNWEPFVERFGHRGDFDERFGTRRAPRGECLAYYTPELAEAVLRGDKHMFEAFGYDTCCGPARRPIS